MSTDVFELHIQQSLQKLEDLWQRSNEIPTPDSELWQNTKELPQQQQQLLQESLAELSASIEELQLATETLKQQNEALLTSRQQIEAERQYYQELFDVAPDCYLVTSKEGTITEVNQKATELLGVSAQYLTRKALAVFIDLQERGEYYSKLNQLKRGVINSATWKLNMIDRQQDKIVVECTVIGRKNIQDQLIELFWRIEPIKSDSELENTTNLSTIIIDHLRYPLYNLVTQIEELKIGNQSDRVLCDRLQNINKNLVDLRKTTNNVYILEGIENRKALNLSLVDYSFFIERITRKFQKFSSTRQPITVKSQNSYVGICDVFLLEQAIINILAESNPYLAKDHLITFNLTQDNSQQLLIKIKFVTNKLITEELSTLFSPLVDQHRIELISLSDLNLAVVKKCLRLLKGTIEIEFFHDVGLVTSLKFPSITSFT